MSFQGKKNVYMCPKCGHGFVTIDIDEGVTPFLTGCLHSGCNGLAVSFCYRAPQDILADVRPALEWYRPTGEDLAALKPASLDHVARGGLLSRKPAP
jgi:predicted  nucleic acid-binding Zn-ribbon protein